MENVYKILILILIFIILISEGDKLLENYKLESKNNSKQNFQRKIETIVDETLDLFDVHF